MSTSISSTIDVTSSTSYIVGEEPMTSPSSPSSLSPDQQQSDNNDSQSSSIATTKWTILPTSNNPSPRFDNTLVHFEGYLYIYGGNDGNTNSSGLVSFLRLDLSTNSWQAQNCQMRPRVLHSAVTHGRSMYVYGGGVYEDERTSFFGSTSKVFKTINDLIKYDFDTKDWTKIENNDGIPRDGHCSIVVDDNIYIIGGSQSTMSTGRNTTMQSTLFQQIAVYNITNNEWSYIPSPTFGRLCSAIHYNRNDKDYIYVFGGYDTQSRPNNDLWQIDIQNSSWKLIPTTAATPPPRYGHTANLFEDKMYVYGGYSKKGFLRDFYSYDFTNEEWRLIPTSDSPPKRRRHQAVVLDSNDDSGRPRMLLYGGAYLSCLYNDLWEYVFPSKVHIPSDKLVDDFLALFNSAEEYFSDIAFIVEGKRIPAHRNILAVRSNYFKSLFTNGLKESFERDIVIKDEKYEEFKAMIKFIYTGDEGLVNLDNCMGLLHLSDCYLISRLKIVCEAKATEGIALDTVVTLFKQADFYRLTKLRQICISFIAKNHKECLTAGILTGLESSVLLEIMYCLDPSLNTNK